MHIQILKYNVVATAKSVCTKSHMHSSVQWFFITSVSTTDGNFRQNDYHFWGRGQNELCIPYNLFKRFLSLLVSNPPPPPASGQPYANNLWKPWLLPTYSLFEVFVIKRNNLFTRHINTDFK